MRKYKTILTFFYMIAVSNLLANEINLPKYLKTYKLDKFNTYITRITDFKTTNFARHRYAKNQPFNSNSTLIKLETTYLLDAKNYTLLKILPKQIHKTTSIWSHKDPNKMFIFRDDGKILTYNVKNNKLKTIIVIKGYENVSLGLGEGNIDIHDKYAAFACKSGNDLDIVIIDLQKRALVAKKRFKNRWGMIDWVSVSQSGKYSVILWNRFKNSHLVSGDVKTYLTKDLSYINTLHDYGNHGDFGFDSNGDEVYVQFAGVGSINAYRLKDAKATVIQKDRVFEIGANRHLSCRNYKLPGWCFASTDKNGKIFAIKIDSSGFVKPLAYHNSSLANYKKSPMPVPNPTGTKVMFASDFQRSYNLDEVYDFVIEGFRLKP